jgi:hypothetical protein
MMGSGIFTTAYTCNCLFRLLYRQLLYLFVNGQTEGSITVSDMILPHGAIADGGKSPSVVGRLPIQKHR